jgi:hypothetical protein
MAAAGKLSLVTLLLLAGCSSTATSTAGDAASSSDATNDGMGRGDAAVLRDATSEGDAAVLTDATSEGDVGVDAGVPEASFDASTQDVSLDSNGCSPWVDAGPPVLFYDLRAAPFPDASAPSVAVHIPQGFDPSNHPGLIVFFHGYDNCVGNVVGAVDVPCTDGGPARAALHLADQLDGAHVNAILVAVELRVDQATGDPGQLATPGAFRSLLHELLTEHLDAVLACPLDVDGLDRVVLSAHSGGYAAAASVLEYGMVTEVREVDLLDALFGDTLAFDAWVQGNAAQFDPIRSDGLRWVDIYTESGGAATNSRAMAVSAQGWLSDAGLAGSVLFDDTTATLDAGQYVHPVVFKLSGLTHDQVPQSFFQDLAKASGFAALP